VHINKALSQGSGTWKGGLALMGPISLEGSHQGFVLSISLP